jgi:hypothetical protein
MTCAPGSLRGITVIFEAPARKQAPLKIAPGPAQDQGDSSIT